MTALGLCALALVVNEWSPALGIFVLVIALTYVPSPRK